MSDPEADAGAPSDPARKALNDSNGNAVSANSHPVPRLCHLRRWEGLSYGFNLISRKGKTGHFIESIEYGLAAYYSGLKNGDRVVEIDGVSVTDMPHGDVVKLIKESGKDGVRLLVVDQRTEDYFKEKGYTIKSSSKSYQVQFIASPVERPPNVVEEETRESNEVRIRDKPRKKSSIFKRFSTPEPPPPLPIDAILPVETVYATLSSADDLDGSLGERPSVRPKLPGVGASNVRSEAGRAKSPAAKANSVMANGKAGGARSKATIPNTNSLQSKLRRLSAGKVQPKARLCHLFKSHRETYGFVLRTYHDTMEKMIVRLDDDGVAIRTGIKDMDFLIEIDGVNVSKENHQQVTTRIRNATDEITLLVVSPEDMVWFRRNSIVPKATEAQLIQTPGAKGKPPKVVNNEPQLRTGDQLPVRNLNMMEPEERSSTRMDEFQLSEYNSSLLEEEKRKEEERLAEQARQEQEEEEQRKELERQDEERRRQEEAEEQEKQQAAERQREAAERQRKVEEQRQEEERRRAEEEASQVIYSQIQAKPVSAEPATPSVPAPTPRKSSRDAASRSVSVSEKKPERKPIMSRTTSVQGGRKTREEEQQDREVVSEVNGSQEEEKSLEDNLNVSVAEIKRRLAAASDKKKKRPVRENAI